MLKIFELHELYDILKMVANFLILSATCFFLFKYSKKKLFANFYFRAILAIILFASLPTFITGTLVYGQQPIETLRRTQNYYSYFIFVVLYYWLGVNLAAIKRLNFVLVSLSIVLCSLFIFCALNPGVGRAILVDSAFLPDRFGIQRLTTLSATVPFTSYSIIYLFLLLTQSRGYKVLKALVPFLIMVFFYLFVFMSRSVIMAMLVLITVYVLTKLPLKIKLLFIYVTVLVLLLSQIFFTNGLLDLVYNSCDSLITESTKHVGSVGIRTEGIMYLLNGFVATTGGIGFGLVSTERAQWNVLSEGLSRGYNPADMGIIGVFLIYGFPAILLTIVICKRFFKDISTRNKLYGDKDIILIQKALGGYLILSFLTLSQFFFWDFFSLSWGIFFYMFWASSELSKYANLNSDQVVC